MNPNQDKRVVAKWEYKLIRVQEAPLAAFDSPLPYPEATEAWLNKLGQEGWELVMYGSGHLTFKRRIRRHRIEYPK